MKWQMFNMHHVLENELYFKNSEVIFQYNSFHMFIQVQMQYQNYCFQM